LTLIANKYKIENMRMNKNEPYEEWMERVRAFELEIAKKELAKGHPVDEVLQRMSDRITQKLLHPVLMHIKDSNKPIDLEASKKAYEEAYLSKNGPKSDHVSED